MTDTTTLSALRFIVPLTATQPGDFVGPSATLKSAAENVIKNIEGVEKVTNNIEVLPLSPHLQPGDADGVIWQLML